MTDSDEREELAAKHERNREQRLAEVKRWAEYVKTTPASEWGEQVNRVVNAQIDAAREADLPADHYRRVERAGREWAEETDE